MNELIHHYAKSLAKIISCTRQPSKVKMKWIDAIHNNQNKPKKSWVGEGKMILFLLSEAIKKEWEMKKES